MFAMQFTIELDIGLSFVLQAALPWLVTDRETETHRRRRSKRSHWEMAAHRGYADGSAHRILSDPSMLLARRDHRLIVVGDWNLVRGYGENADVYWKARYDKVFQRAAALGMHVIGPEYPNGRRAEPWAGGSCPGTACVCRRFHHSRQTAVTATRQLDYVVASASIADRIEVRAISTPEVWGPSDHCRVVIDFHS